MKYITKLVKIQFIFHFSLEIISKLWYFIDNYIFTISGLIPIIYYEGTYNLVIHIILTCFLYHQFSLSG